MTGLEAVRIRIFVDINPNVNYIIHVVSPFLHEVMSCFVFFILCNCRTKSSILQNCEALHIVLYHYAGNNPVKYTDPDGNFFIPPQVIAFGIGALIGAGTEFIWQLVENEGDISKIDGSAIFWSGLSGGASAFMATTGFGLGGQIIANTVINSLAELGHQLTDKEKGIDGFEILGAAIGGAVAGWVGGPGNKDISSQTNRLIKRVGNALKHGNYNEVGKALVYFQKMTKTFSKMMTKEQLKDAVKHFIPDKLLEDTVNKIFDAYKKAREEE